MQIVSKGDMAERWGVSKQVVKNWEDRHQDFPKPVTFVHSGKLPLYSLEDVEEYEKKRGLKKSFE